MQTVVAMMHQATAQKDAPYRPRTGQVRHEFRHSGRKLVATTFDPACQIYRR
jgi:hypothetical protein